MGKIGLYAERDVAMYNARPLMDVVPVYEFVPRINNECVESEYSDDWVDEIKELGDKGENIVKSFLEKQYEAVVSKQPDSAGYDFLVNVDGNISYVEVKTSYEGKNRFYLSYNEIEKSKLYGIDYNIYYVCLNKYGGVLYVIKDPFALFDLSGILEYLSENEISSLKVDSVKISIKDFSKFIAVNNFIVDV